MKIDIIGIPIDLGADRRGVDMGPSAIRYAHLQKKLEALGYTVEDKGNIEVPIAEMCSIAEPKLKYIDCIVPMSRHAAARSQPLFNQEIFRLYWVVITALHSVRFEARQNSKSLAWFGLMLMQISILIGPRRPVIFMGCRSPRCADSGTRA